MAELEKAIKGIRKCLSRKPCSENDCPYENECAVEHLNDPLLRDALELLKEQDSRIKRYEYIFDFLGIGFREWATKILEGKAEAICESDEHKRETIIRFKHI